MIIRCREFRAVRTLFIAVFIISLTVQAAFAGDKVFMWKVESPQATAYILGTVHMMKKEMYPLDARIRNAFEKSGTYALEFDINEITTSQTASLLTDIIYSGGDTIRDHLSRETFELAQKKFAEYGLPFDQMVKFRPWFLAVTIEMLAYEKLGLDPQYGIEIYFLQKAEGVKEIVELESFDSQMQLFRSMPDRDQELFLIYTLKDIDTIEKNMDYFLRVWSEGNAGEMERLIFRYAEEDPRLSQIYELFFYERNRNMADKIEKMLGKKCTYFVAVGAGHLVGKQGIIDLLARKGYSVRQQ